MDMIDLKKIERKAFLTYHKDGLLDIVLGFILMVGVLSSTLLEMGVSDAIRISIYVPLMIVGPVFFMVYGKRKITIPRLGYVKFGEKRKRNRKKLIIAIILINLFIFIALFATITNKLDQISTVIGINTVVWMAVLIFCFVFSVFFVFAYLHDNPRLYITGFLMAITEPIYTSLEIFTSIRFKALIAYGIPGILLLTLGFFAFLQFLKKYPKVVEEQKHA